VLTQSLVQAPAREAIQQELARLGAPALRVLLASARAAEPELRAAAAETLGRLRNTQALPTLRLMTRDEDQRVRQAAAAALEAYSAAE
jgi:HEAT repeat protein